MNRFFAATLSFFVLATVFVLHQNCGQKDLLTSSLRNYSSCLVAGPHSFVNDKVQVSSFSNKSANYLPRDTELLILTNTRCAREARRNLSQKTRYAISHGISGVSANLIDQATNDSTSTQPTHVISTFSLPNRTSEYELRKFLSRDPCVVGVTRKFPIHTNAVLSPGAYSQQYFHSSIKSSEGWDIAFGSFGIAAGFFAKIAIIDTGVDRGHPDLSANLDLYQRNFSTGSSEGGPSGPVGSREHGTHVAGLAAAYGENNNGYSGLMERNAKIMAMAISDSSGALDVDGGLNAIEYAANNGALVANLSWGGMMPSTDGSAIFQQVMADAANKGLMMTVAAGNGYRICEFYVDGAYSYQCNSNGTKCKPETDSDCSRVCQKYSCDGTGYSQCVSENGQGNLSELSYICSAGSYRRLNLNSGVSIGGTQTFNDFPAAVAAANPCAITVGATNDEAGGSSISVANFSNIGTTAVEISAPGTSSGSSSNSGIPSTVPGGGYASYAGTSMAAPIVAGAAAAAYALIQSRTNNPARCLALCQVVKNHLQSSADSVQALQSSFKSGRRLNFGRLMSSVSNSFPQGSVSPCGGGQPLTPTPTPTSPNLKPIPGC